MNDHAGGGPSTAGFRGGSPGRRRGPLPTRVDLLPDLPSAYEHALDAGLAEIPLALGAAARVAIATQARLLLAWNEAINLTAITDPEGIALRHVVDSLAAVPLLAAWSAARPIRIVDVGSGAGYPGLPIAAAVPAAQVLLVDSIAKKARFLDAAVAATGVAGRVMVANERFEVLAARVRDGAVTPFDVATARAVGSLSELAQLTFPALARGGRLVAWKRGDLDSELAAAGPIVDRLGGEIRIHDPGVTSLPGHRLVVVTRW
jgi:16S rRNA (guanine527-N7)-methyltransferase